MPKNRLQETVFTIMMVLVMVYAMICYNIAPVSYTHLDVYKRQASLIISAYIKYPAQFVTFFVRKMLLSKQ